VIYGTRVRQAREFRQTQQGELAGKLGVSSGRLSQIEHSESVELSASQVDALVANLRMPASFFSRPPVDELGEGSMRFRAQVKVTKKVRSAARREADLALEIYAHLLETLDVPAPLVPTLPATTDIEEAAEHTRAALGIAPDAVVPNAVRALERAGIVIVAFETEEDEHLDGFSNWWGSERRHPVIALSTSMSWDRRRHTVVHELAHLVMHRGAGMDGMDGRAVERQADQFAGAFLFPRDSALEELPRPVTLRQLIPLKQRWGVSIGSLLSRARQLGVIDADESTSLWKQMSARRWRTVEPLADLREPELPRALRQMAELVYDLPADSSTLATSLAADLNRYRRDVDVELGRYAGGRAAATTSAPAITDGAMAPVISLRDRRPG
jgi:Zn-dependent peptidase ImmA (M78 family)